MQCSRFTQLLRAGIYQRVPRPPQKTGRIKTALYGDNALFRVQRDVVLEWRHNTKIMIIDI